MADKEKKVFIYEGKEKIERAPLSQEISKPVIVTTLDAVVDKKGEYKAAYFLFIQSPAPVLLSETVECNVTTGDDAAAEFDKNFIINEMLSIAMDRLYAHLSEIQENTGNNFLPPGGYDFVSSGEIELHHLWGRGKFHNEINLLVEGNRISYQFRKILEATQKLPFMSIKR